MISALSDWLRHLAILILVAVFLDLVLPSTSLQRYVRLTLGLLVMLAMLAPLRAVITSGLDVGSLEAQLSGPLLSNAELGVSAHDGLQTFRSDLAATVGQDVRTTLGVNMQNVSVQVVTKPDGTPVVTGLTAEMVGTGIDHPGLIAKTAKEQIATLLGLPLSSVTIYYLGGQA